MENPNDDHLSAQKKEMFETLVSGGISEEDSAGYVDILIEHEIDNSILRSKLLTQEIIREVGVKKIGHIIKILEIGKRCHEQREIELQSQREAEAIKGTDLTLDSALKGSDKVENSKSDIDFGANSVQEDVILANKKAGKMNIDASEMSKRAKWIPLRLNEKERQLLKLLESGLYYSDYTDKVDIISWSRKTERSTTQLKLLFSALSGLLVSSDYSLGEKVVTNRKYRENYKFFQDVFEVGRRYKITNPEKMRTEYGKLMHILMDTANDAIQHEIGFKCVKPLTTVYSFLKEQDALDALYDERIFEATEEITPDGKVRDEIDELVKRKNESFEYICEHYSNENISKEDLALCLHSIGDNNSFLNSSRAPVEKMINFLQDNFERDTPEHNFSLEIRYGRGGARLSHDHKTQYFYCLHSLTLWSEIIKNFFMLWIMAESDALAENSSYRLCDTGQGLNRIKSAPLVGHTMDKILGTVKHKLGGWIGSSAVHLGDHNVPNALIFIDKYTQVARIITPIVLTIESIDEMIQTDENIKKLIKRVYGSAQKCKKTILQDFFKHAFDGSGADNFFDAGSCIDGRLTSAWNWCSKIANFIGFDGSFRN